MTSSNKRLGRTVGLLFLVILLIGPLSLSLRGLSTSMFESATLYNDISTNALQMRLSVLFDILAAIISVGIAVILYPVMKDHNNKLALWYLGLYITYLAVIIISDVDRLSLISLSINLTESSYPSNWNKLGLLLFESYIHAHFISLIIYSAASILLYYFLFLAKMVPRLIAGWGILAVLMVFIVTWMQIFDMNVSFAFYVQNGVFMLIFIGWLLVKGFAESPLHTTRDEKLEI